LSVIQVAVINVQLGGSVFVTESATSVTGNGNFQNPRKLGMGGSFAN
jgi:hypothetical protein